MVLHSLPQGTFNASCDSKRFQHQGPRSPSDAWSDSRRLPQDCRWGSEMPLPGAQVLHGAEMFANIYTLKMVHLRRNM